MTAKVLKRSRAKFVSKQTVEQMGITLQELPEKTPDTLSLRQTIERLREPIEAALAKGYSYDELVPMLAQQDINIQPSTLKRYVLSGGDRVTRKRASAGKTTTRQSRKKSGDAASSIISTESQMTDDLTEVSEAPAPQKSGRTTAKTSPESTASAEAQPEPAKQSRSRRTATGASAAAKSRTSSTRGGRKAKA